MFTLFFLVKNDGYSVAAAASEVDEDDVNGLLVRLRLSSVMVTGP